MLEIIRGSLLSPSPVAVDVTPHDVCIAWRHEHVPRKPWWRRKQGTRGNFFTFLSFFSLPSLFSSPKILDDPWGSWDREICRCNVARTDANEHVWYIQVFLARKRVAIEIFRDLLANTDVQRTSLDRSALRDLLYFLKNFWCERALGIGKYEIRRWELEYRELLISTKIFSIILSYQGNEKIILRGY